MSGDLGDLIRRPFIENESQSSLFDDGPSWQTHWWGMPSFEMKDALPTQSIVVNFRSWDDVLEFGKRLGLTVSRKTDSLWFPQENNAEPKEFVYSDES